MATQVLDLFAAFRCDFGVARQTGRPVFQRAVNLQQPFARIIQQGQAYQCEICIGLQQANHLQGQRVVIAVGIHAQQH